MEKALYRLNCFRTVIVDNFQFLCQSNSFQGFPLLFPFTMYDLEVFLRKLTGFFLI